jgi:drug/metabolite transporter (DMT)-like permease
MSSNRDEHLREIWTGQSVPALLMTPEQLRARAEQLEASIRRRNLRDHLSFVLVAVAFGGGAVVVPGLLTRLGCLLLASWALLSIYWLRRYGAIAVASGAADSQVLIDGHQRQLERQRDIALSWPWGVGLAFPGLVLYSLGFAWGPRPIDASISVALVGVFTFLYIAIGIYGKSLAGRWQREIDSLSALKR